jgi:hypothetical protein
MTAERVDLGEPDGLAGEIVKRWREARDHWSRWREEARECYGFYAGIQWNEDDLARLAEEMRPAIVFNRVAPLVDAVLGHEANNRVEIRYVPRTQGDVRVAEMLTNASAYFRDQCDAEHEESDAFRDTLISGMGWTQIRLSDERNPQYDLVEERVDPLEMLPDPGARKPNLADARWLLREKRMSREEIAVLWPDHDLAQAMPGWASGTAGMASDRGYGDGAGDRHGDDGWLVLEYQWKDVQQTWMVSRPDTGERTALDAEDFEERREDIEKLGLSVEMQRRTVVRRAFLIGNDIVQQDAPCPHHFSYTAITGKRDHEGGVWFGIVRSLLDPQRWANKWLSQMLHIVNSNAKGGVMLERSAAVDASDFEARWADPAGIIWLNDGALRQGQVMPKPPPVWPAGVERLLEHATRAFTEVSGVNAELLGLVDRQQPGVLEWQRKQSAVTLLAPLFDALRRFRKMKGRTWLYWMQHYIADGRLVRIVSDGGQNGFVPFWRDPAVADYDVIVDQASSAPNVKEQTWGTLVQLFPALRGMIDPQIMLMLLEYSPLPESLVAKLRGLAADRAKQPAQPSPQLAMVMAEAEAGRARLQADLALKQQQAQAELALKRERIAADLMLERERALVEANSDIEVAKLKAGIEPQAVAIGAEVRTQEAQRDIALAQAVAGIGSGFATLGASIERSVQSITAALLRPRTLIRDEHGRATGVQ